LLQDAVRTHDLPPANLPIIVFRNSLDPVTVLQDLHDLALPHSIYRHSCFDPVTLLIVLAVYAPHRQNDAETGWLVPVNLRWFLLR
jgi:hypothetical protein